MGKTVKSRNIKIILALITIVLTTVVGVSFAYFSVTVTGNEETSSIKTTTADLKLTFTDGEGINITDIYPGWSKVKTFSVTNTGSDTAYYDIKMYNVYSTFIDDELVYTLTSTNSGGSKSETIMPNNDGLIKAKIAIPSGVTQTFTMTIKFKELNKYQDNNQGASYKGIIQIISPYIYTNGVTAQDITLRERILLDNTEAPLATTRSKYVASSSGIAYSKPSDHAYKANEYFTYEETVSLTSTAAGNRAIGPTITMESVSGLFTVGGDGKATSQTYSQDSIGKFTCNTNSYTCTAGNLYQILEVTGTTVTKALRYIPKANKSSWNGLGLYQTNVRTVNNGTTYFFRGHVVNNYVSFAGIVWRIVRINEDGTIKLIKQTTAGTVKYNTSTNNKRFVGYMYGTTDDPYANNTSSNIKNSLATFYTTYLASYSDYIYQYPQFCNDRGIQSTSGTTIYFEPRRRLSSNSTKTPTLTCGKNAEEKERDLFTMPGDAEGNHLLGYPIGMITADELYLAGAMYAKASKYYINTGNTTYSMSPYYCTSSTCYMFYTGANGYTSTGSVSTNGILRPVINLKADTLVLGGSGSATDPYIITTN